VLCIAIQGFGARRLGLRFLVAFAPVLCDTGDQMMRAAPKTFFAVLAVLAMSVAPALAYENFIPLGTGYSTEVGSLPLFESDEGQVIQKTDIYESEIYRRARGDAEFDSRMRQFFSDGEAMGPDYYLDY
jgi:hypothetical protein